MSQREFNNNAAAALKRISEAAQRRFPVGEPRGFEFREGQIIAAVDGAPGAYSMRDITAGSLGVEYAAAITDPKNESLTAGQRVLYKFAPGGTLPIIISTSGGSGSGDGSVILLGYLGVISES